MKKQAKSPIIFGIIISSILILFLFCFFVLAASPTDWYYQEHANETSYDGGWANVPDTYDGDWDSYGSTVISFSNLSLNYTKPANVLSSSKWEVKDEGGRTNLTIPSSCWSYDADKLIFVVYSTQPELPLGVEWLCKNNSGWQSLRFDSSSDYVYEEAMNWEIDTKPPNVTISSPTNSTYNTITIDFNVTATDAGAGVDSCLYSLNSGVKNYTMLNDTATHFYATNSSMTQGSHTITYYCNDTISNINGTETETFFIDSIYPLISMDSPANNTNTTDTGLDIKYTYTETNCDSVWWNDGDGANTTLTNCYDNITAPTWGEGKHNITIFINDTANNINSTAVSFTIDTTGPTITIADPKAQNYNTNNSMPLNYTVTDAGTEVDSCWYKVINSSSVLIDNTTIASCANTTFALPGGDFDYNLTLYSNDTLNNLGSSIVAFGIRTIAPSTVLDEPIDHQNLSSGTNVYFNFTSTDTDGLDTCQLWHNNTGTWHKNYTWIGPSSGVMNFTTLDLSENTFIWNVWCNDTVNNYDFSLSNFTLTIDETNPQISLVYPTNTSYNAIQTELNFSYSDINVASCWYSTDGGTTNITHTSCANITGLNSGQGTSTWLIGINDSAGNKNYSTVVFFVDSIYPKISYEPETPADYANLSQSNIYINVTWTETNLANITFSLYNSTGTINSTTFTTATYDINWTNLSDSNNYTYQVNITDTLNNKNYTLLRNITLDTINPIVNITTENGTVVSETQSITVEYNISDTYLKSCYFTLRTTGGLVHNYPENSSLSCTSTSRSISTLVFGTFILQMWGEDYAGNLDYENLTFTTYSGGPGGGGGGGAVLPEEEEEPEVEKTFCGDGICQKEGNDYGIKENFYNCASDCPGFNFDEFIWSFSKYCWDGDPSTVCIFTQLFATVPGVEVEANMTVFKDGQVCIGEICERISGKTLFSNCFKEGLPCFWQSNVAFLVLFLGGSTAFAISFIKVRSPGIREKVSPYGYVVLRAKKLGRRKRR